MTSADSLPYPLCVDMWENFRDSIPTHKFDVNHSYGIWFLPTGSFVAHFAGPVTSLVFVCFILISENTSKTLYFTGWNEVE